MARDYSRVGPAYWTGTTGRELRAAGRDVQLLGLYLMTSPHANMIGLYQLALPTLCHEAGFTIEGASKALRCLSQSDFAHYDPEAEEVWVPAMARFQVLDPGMDALNPGDKRCKGVERELSKFSKSKFFGPFVRRYKAAFHLPFDAPPEVHRSPTEGPSEAPRSQEQEQEQAQEQKPAAAARARRGGKRRKLDPEAQASRPTESGAAPAAASPSAEAESGKGSYPNAPVTLPSSERCGQEPTQPEPAAAGPVSRQPERTAGTDAPSTEAAPGAGNGGHAGGEEPPAPAHAEGGGHARPEASSAAGNVAEPLDGPGELPAPPPVVSSSRGPIVDDIPARKLDVLDLADGGLGPLGAEFKRLAEAGYKRGPLRWAAADKRAMVATELERLIGDEQRLEQLVGIWVQDALAREVGRGPPTASMTGVLLDLRRLAPLLGADPLAEVRKRCPQWAKVLDEIRRLPAHVTPLPPGAFESLLLPLDPALTGKELVLTAPNEWQANAIQDVYGSLVREGVAKFIGRDVTVQVVAAAPAAAGGAL